MRLGWREVPARETWRVLRTCLPRRLLHCLIGSLVFATASVVGWPFSSVTPARDDPPSVLDELRTWVTTHTGLNRPQLLSAATVLTKLQIWVAAERGADPSQPPAPTEAAQPQAGPLMILEPAGITQAPATTTLVSRSAVGVNYPSGCAAALAFLAAHAAPGFVASCPHADGGYQATTTCVGAPQCEPGTAFIWIDDPCPAAYLNEASNSWVLIGKSSAPIDAYGYCGEPDNPYG